ncbi:hypothetical protein [Hyphomonas sp. CY54-11-8]|uniref:hypothetical protein n=1 Tax=Hyphomonas sp. CY54-11-8 TaxID=1280944 RepID=UPI000458F7E7|nr:hypothetical protein [Hyphomonas sp. CY54-11-8]KCZ47781.1 hypothetical protein HY17_04710 [Hyphomonas sp. CY54-11-8]
MPTREELGIALKNAHTAGDAEAARKLAAAIQQMDMQPSMATTTPDFQNGGMDLVSEGGPQSQPKMGRAQSGYTGAQSGFAWGTADEQAGIKRLRADKLGRVGEGVNFAARFIPGMGVADAAAGTIADMRGMGGSFREGVEDRRAQETKARTDNPVSYMAGEIVGSSVAPVGGSARAATKTAQIGKGMATGAGAGGVYSFGAEDGTLLDRAKAGGIGAVGGAAFGGALSAVIPRNIPLGDVLNAELFGAKVERPVLKTIERMLIDSGVSPNDISAGIVNIRQRLQSGDVSSGLPTRFKDELVKEFGEKARGVSKAVENQIRGGAARSGSASDAAVAAAVSEDNAAARELFSRSLDQFAGTASRPELRGQAIDQLGQIVEEQYKPILAQPIVDPAKKQALVDVLNLPRMQKLTTDLAEDAEREGIDLAQMIQNNPAEAAHWMQSKARQLADDRGRVSASGRVLPDRTMSNRRQDILNALEDAVPGYREARMEFGDKYGVTQAVNFAKGFLSRAKDDVAVSDMAEEFSNMSQAQQQMAVASMRSILQGSAENVRYVDPEVGASALRTAEIGKEPVLRALSDVFGEQGTKIADDIKAIVSRTDANRRINPQATGSDTTPKAEAIKFAMRNTRGPLQRGIGAVFGSVPSDLLGSALVGAPTPIGAARAASQGVGKMADRRAMSTVDKVTELLLARPQNALAPNNAPRGGSPPVSGGSIVDQIGQEAQTKPANALAPQQPMKSSGTATFGNDLANAAVGGTVGGMGGSFSGEFIDYNKDGKIDETDKQIGFLIGTGVGAFGAPAGTRVGVKGQRFDMKGSGPSGKLPKLKGSASVDVSRQGDTLTINMLKVPEGLRGTGEASRAVDDILKQADAEGLTVFLTADPVGSGGLSKSQLEAFYKRRGFVSNSGRNKDFRAQAGMVRHPQTPMRGAGISGPPKPPKLMKDVPRGKPPKGGNPNLGQGNLIRQQYEGKNPPRLPEGPMTDAQIKARKAREAAMPLIEQGLSGEAIRQQTGVQTLTYKGQTVILPPYLNGVNNEAIHRFFYDSLKQPFEKRPKWVQNALRQIASSEDDALRQQSLWDQKNPLALGTERTPMVKPGKNALSGK